MISMIMSYGITVIDETGEEFYFKVNYKTTLGYVWQAYCQIRGSYILFSYNNNTHVKKEDYNKTIVELGIKNLTVYF